MLFLRFLLASATTIALIVLLDRPLSLGDKTLPPLGAFFSPQHGFWMNAEPAGARSEARNLDDLKVRNSISIIFDEQMIPRIYAENELDAAFAQGYVSAMMRLFQMDLSTRAPLGRLSEILGERTLNFDLEQRRKGMLRTAERLAQAWENDPSIQPLLQAFTDGVNARIEEMDPRCWPLEYKLLDFEPEQWTFVRSAAFLLAMCETLAQTAHDIPLSNAYQIVGPADFPFLYPNHNPFDIPVIPDSTGQTHPSAPVSNDVYSGLETWGYQDWLPASEPGIGSNNWALGRSKTLNQQPILCNDPHLKLTLPSIWLEMQITTPGHSAYGVAFPPLVGIAIGFNEDIAWGFTNAGHDVRDWYAIRWTDAEKTAYLYDGEVRMADLHVESIRVKGREEPVLDTIRYTVWGPVPNLKAGTPQADLAMHWLPMLDIDDQMAKLFQQINQASSLNTWRSPLLRYDVPMQNALFASKSGDIALRVSGLLPIRPPYDGRLVQDGSTSRFTWQGFVPDDQNPYVENPEQGYIASANQESTSPSYPYAYYGVWEAWRGRYLNTRLREKNDMTVEDMMALQNDNTSLQALEAMATYIPLVETSRLTTTEQVSLRSLTSWDGQYQALQNMPVLFELWNAQIDSLTWDELYAAQDSMPVEIPDNWRLLELIRKHPDLPWFDHQQTSEKENAAAIITRAWKTACSQFQDLSEAGKGYWSVFKSTDILHLARIPAFSAMDLETGGHKHALNAITPTNGPSWRMIVELGQETRAFGIYPGGQSGNPGSRFYRNFLPAWQKGTYRSLHILSKDNIMNQHRLLALTLNPSRP